MKKRKLHLSASSISTFKSCPTRWKGAYVLGFRPEEETEALRVGSHWHRILDISSLKSGAVCPVCAKTQTNSDCTICEGTDTVPEDIMEAVTRELNAIYTDKNYGDPEKMEVERTKLIYSLVGYRWYYQNQPEEVITREQQFELSLINPISGRTLPNVILVGMIDKLIDIGKPAIKEHKSTSKSVDPDSSYWGHLNLDTQTTLYLYAIRRLQADGLLVNWGIKAEDPPINTIMYDVWHKPTIKPKKLSQSDSKKFVATGEYCEEEFKLVYPLQRMTHIEDSGLLINETKAEIEPGKKEGTFVIRETPEMYGARLLQDITERPGFYFRCIEMTRTQQEMEQFEHELINIYRNMQSMIHTGHFYRNEHQCEATFKCDYIGQCYNGITLDAKNPPEGFKVIFDKEEV